MFRNIIKGLPFLTLLCATAFGAAAAGEGYVLGGYQCYNKEEKLGWYRMKSDGAATFVWADKLLADKNYPMLFGWMRDSKICGVSSLLNSGVLYNYDYVEINPENGEYLLTRAVNMRNDDGTVNYLNYFNCAAYDPVSDRVYGYGYNADGTAFAFKSTSHDFTDTRVIREVTDAEYCASLTYNEFESRLVGFNRSNFVYIDTETGYQTNAYYPALDNYQFTYTGLMYDVAERAYYWNYFTKDGRSHMALVDIAGKSMRTVCDYTNMTQYAFMVPEGEKVSSEAPAAAEFTSVDFEGASLSGSLSFRLPAETYGGAAISGDLAWKLTVDGNEYAHGTGKPGAGVTQSVTDLTQGEHTFSVSSSLADRLSLPVTVTRFIGLDTPAEPSNVKLGATELTWDAVTVGQHGGFVDPASLTYTVRINGTLLGTTSECRMPVTYPADKEYSAYEGSVSAVNASGASEFVTSNRILEGKPLPLPQTFIPDQLTAPLFTMEDTDGNGNVWSYNNGARGQELFISGYSADTPVDEWFFLPPVACSDPGKVYSVSVNAALNSSTDKPAQIEICVGKTAGSDAMKTVVTPLTVLTGTSLKEYTGLFTLTGEMAGAESAVIGVRAYAPEGGTRVKARRFKVEVTGLDITAPAEPGDITVTAAPEGELRTDISFTFPTRRLNGEEIPPTQDVKVTVFDDASETFTGRPGEKKNVSIRAYQGINTVEITPAIGNVKGNRKTVEVYCGIDIPLAVRNMEVEIADNNLLAELYWDAPDKGLNGGYVDPDGLTYWLCSYNSQTGEYVPYAELGKTPEYLMNVEKGSKLATYQFAIQARSAAGQSPVFTPARVQLGTPYTLNMTETFVGSDGKPAIHYTPLTSVNSGEYSGSSWKITDPAQINPEYAAPYGVAIVGTADAASVKGLLMLPKFSTAGLDDAVLTLEVYQSNSMPEVSVIGRASGMTEDVLIGRLPTTGAGYKQQKFVLPAEFLDKGWVSLNLVAEYADSYRTVIISGYSVTSGNSAVAGTTATDLPFAVCGGEGYLEITGEEGREAMIFTAAGEKAATVRLAGNATRVSLPAGVYAVSAGGNGIKAIVK